MPVTALMQQFVEYEIDNARDLIERARLGALQLLRDPRGGALAGNERVHQAVITDALARQGQALADAFVASLRRQVNEALAAAGPSAAPRGSGPLRLELTDESRVDVDIELSRAAQMIDATAEWELRELQTFTSTLAGARHVSAESNPFRPLVYATALWDAIGAVIAAQAPQLVTLRVVSGVLAGLLKSGWAAAVSRLEALGVEPSVYRTVLLAPGSVPQPPMQRRGPSTVFSALLADAPTPPPQNRGHAVAQDPPESRIAEVFGRLFRAFAADDQVAAEARTVIGRCHDPVLALARQDTALLGSLDHPAWRLVDRLARIGEEFAAGDARQRRLLATAAAEIGRLPTTPETPPGAQDFGRALAAIESQAAEQWDELLHGAEATIDQLRRAERRDVLEHRIAERLTEQIAPMRASPTIRRFVTSTWSRVVAQAIVDRGEQDPATQRYGRAVDDLMWSVAAPDHPQSRQRLLALLPKLLDTLRAGMNSIQLPETEQRALFDELMPIHTEALRPRSAAENERLTSEQIVQRLREEVIEPDEPGRRFGDSVIDVASMDTVPAEFMATDFGGDAPAPEVIPIGAMRRMFIGGRWTHAQLLWRSEQGQYLLFAGEGAGRTHSITRRALERLQGARLVQPIEVRPLVARTLDTLMHQLSLT